MQIKQASEKFSIKKPVKVKTCDIKRHLPKWAKIVKTVNKTPIYNMNILENIMSWNQENLETAALDYYGYRITYGELPDKVNEYLCGFKSLGITKSSIVTLCLPVSIENMLSLFALDCVGAISNNVNFLFLKNDFDLFTTVTIPVPNRNTDDAFISTPMPTFASIQASCATLLNGPNSMPNKLLLSVPFFFQIRSWRGAKNDLSLPNHESRYLPRRYCPAAMRCLS